MWKEDQYDDINPYGFQFPDVYFRILTCVRRTCSEKPIQQCRLNSMKVFSQKLSMTTSHISIDEKPQANVLQGDSLRTPLEHSVVSCPEETKDKQEYPHLGLV